MSDSWQHNLDVQAQGEALRRKLEEEKSKKRREQLFASGVYSRIPSRRFIGIVAVGMVAICAAMFLTA
jgi:hypothetical protein